MAFGSVRDAGAVLLQLGPNAAGLDLEEHGCPYRVLLQKRFLSSILVRHAQSSASSHSLPSLLISPFPFQPMNVKHEPPSSNPQHLSTLPNTSSEQFFDYHPLAQSLLHNPLDMPRLHTAIPYPFPRQGMLREGWDCGGWYVDNDVSGEFVASDVRYKTYLCSRCRVFITT